MAATRTRKRLDHEPSRHEKIRFRREEITNLDALPSAADLHPDLIRRRTAPRTLKLAFKLLASLVGLLLLLLALGYGVASWGLGRESFRAEAAKAIQAAAGPGVSASIGPARIVLDATQLLAVEVADTRLSSEATGDVVVDAGAIRLGLNLPALLSGKLLLGSAKLTDARIMPASMPSGDKRDWLAPVRDARGLIDPGKVAAATFDALHVAFDKVRAGTARRLALDDVEVILPQGGEVQRIKVLSALMTEISPGQLSFTAALDVDQRDISLEGIAARDAVSGRIELVDIAATMTDSRAATTGTTAADAPAAGSRLGATEFAIKGEEGAGAGPSRLSLTFTAADSQLDLGSRGVMPGEIGLAASISTDSPSVEVGSLRLATGRSSYDFNGAFGPKPATDGNEAPVYRYELISNESTLAPIDSNEPALRFATRVAGTYDAAASLLKADQIGVRSSAGEAIGSATVEFLAGKAPGIALALGLRDMPVTQVKQLWPWFTARSARNWVRDHLFGGQVKEGQIQFNVVAGRLGNGVPLSADEISGRFSIAGSRFDTAGLIPPIRDAVGSVEFRGNDVDVALASGTVYMPSGRTVSASNGTMRIVQANKPPVIGDLDIDVTGAADAITELVSYEPINAMRHINMTADDFSGQVSGHVKADIPLQKGIDSSKLDWLVTLNYQDLAIARPLDGQMMTEADGTIAVSPKKAVISAKGKLNGVPAEVDMVEPLRPDGPPRDRKVALVLDDKARNALAPGLSEMVSGPMRVKLDSDKPGVRAIEADLTDAKLNVPWAGWSKGAGIPAKATFVMKTEGSTTTLSDFELDGKSFSVDGAVTLSSGSLSSAQFSSVKLNRDDNVSVYVKRNGKGYAVSVKGASLDARSLIKQFTSDTETANKTTGSGAGGGVTIDADVKSLGGFHGERFSNVKLDYSGAGSKVNGLSVSAVATSGAPISIENSTEDGRRSMKVTSTDAGAVLRFLNIYENMRGGGLSISLSGSGDGPMQGPLDVRDFQVVNEPRLASIVSTRPAGDSRSLNDAVKRDIDTSRVEFERGFARVEKGKGYLKIAEGVLRGPLIGTTFQGTLYDREGNMEMTGTFMPAYGLNRLFGELPLIGLILGNGNDRGLIGVTFKLTGDANSPKLHVNPLSVIAPGIFRSIFEYR